MVSIHTFTPCTGSRLQLASSSRHWCLHIEQPQAQHPPTSTHYYKSTSLQKPHLLPLTITNLHPSRSPSYFHSLLQIYIPPEAPPTSTHYYEFTSPPEPPPTSTHYYKSTSLQKPLLLPLTITNLHPSRSLRSASERRLVVPSQRGTKSLSRTFSFTVPGWWNDLSPPIRTAGSLTIFKRHLKTHLFRLHLTSS